MALSLAEVLREHWPDYSRRNRARLAAAHYRAVRAVLQCRTRALGGHRYHCEHCQRDHYSYHSCNHRSCPRCGALDQQLWCATQEARLLPGVPYYLVTFTIPDSLWPACKQHPAILYDLLLRESAGAMQDLAHTKLGGRLGFTSILHTWGRPMQHHPHVHIVVPAVAFNPATRNLCHPNHPDRFFLHETPLALRFRNRMDLALKKRHPEVHQSLPGQARRDLSATKWRVNCLPVGHGRPALRYLARYVYKTALGPSRILGYTRDGRLRLSYQQSNTGAWRVTALHPDTFIQRFLTHVLPKGFVRVRHYGWMSGAARKTRLLVRALVCGQIGEPTPKLPELPKPCCPDCGALMNPVATLAPLQFKRGPPIQPS